MSCLLYCIFRTDEAQRPERTVGIAGQPIRVVAQNGLSVALSELASSMPTPAIEDTLAYAKVVEAFHHQRTVIPLRYGCYVADSSEAADLLETHHREYEKLLAELEGADEMGIRVLLPEAETEADDHPRPGLPKSLTLPCDSGAAYLAARRQHYLDLDRAASDQRLLVNELCESLSGLFLQCKVEWHDSARNRFLSLHFLVPRALLRAFRDASCRFPSRRPVKLLLSGPWPPFNFVDSRQEQEACLTSQNCGDVHVS